jgi:hypothetical protein
MRGLPISVLTKNIVNPLGERSAVPWSICKNRVNKIIEVPSFAKDSPTMTIVRLGEVAALCSRDRTETVSVALKILPNKRQTDQFH